MDVCCECCVFSGRGLCDELITRPEEFFRLWCVVMCDLETSRIRRPLPALDLSPTTKKMYYLSLITVVWTRSLEAIKCVLKHPVKSIPGLSSIEPDDGSHRFTVKAKEILNDWSQTVKCEGTNEFCHY
jgi:hypothetical protein